MPSPFGPHYQNTFFQLRVVAGRPAYGYARWVAGDSPKKEFQYLLPRSYAEPANESTASWMNESAETSYDEWSRFVSRMKAGAIPYELGVGMVKEFVQTEFKTSFAAHFSEYPVLAASGDGPEHRQFNDGFVLLSDPADPDVYVGAVAIAMLETGHAELWQLGNPTTFPRTRFLAQYFSVNDAFTRLNAQPITAASRRYAVLTTFTVNGLPPH